jgi:hypothetical protein
MEISLGKKKAD